MRCVPGVLIVALALAKPAAAADLDALVQRIKAVGPEGAGNAEAAAAWKELSRLRPDDLPKLLTALDGASPAAANYLRSAIDAVAERACDAKQPLPAVALEAFLRDTRHSGRARRLAYELLCAADPTAPRRLLPTFLNDPGAELRYEAVAMAFAAARQQPKGSGAAKDELRRLLAAARDNDQVGEIAKELGRRGESVDLVAHFGFITHWHVAGVFDNTGGKGLQAAYPPERGVDLRAKYRGKSGREVVWRPHTATEADGKVDLNKVFADPSGKERREKDAVAYGYTVVESPAERAVEVRAASATALKIFVNGEEVLAREAYHQSFDQDSYVAPARLKKGRNTILIKVCQNNQTEPFAQNWMYQLRVTDDLGAPIPLTALAPADAVKGVR
jgi:hypothetical protein